MTRFTQKYDQILVRWIKLIERHAILVMIVALTATGLASAYTVRNLSINTEMVDMIDADLPWRQTSDRYAELFPQLADTILVVVDADMPERADEMAEELAARLQEQKGQIQSVYAPDLMPFFDRNGLLYLEVEELERLSDRLAAVQPLLGELTADPSLRGLFGVLGEAVDKTLEEGETQPGLEAVLTQLALTAETTLEGAPRPVSWQQLIRTEAESGAAQRFLLIRPALDFNKLRPAADAITAIRENADAIAESLGGDVRVRLTGPATLRAEELDSVAESAGLAGLLSLLLVSLIVAFGMRSVRLVLSVLAALVIGLIWTATFAFAVIGYLNLISVAFAVLFIGLGVDFAVHLVLRYREEIAFRGPDRAMQRAGGGVGRAMCICAPTTAFAFFAFTPTAYVGLSQLGIISGTGMFIALIVSLTIIPAFLKLLPLKHVKLHTVTFRPTATLNLNRYSRSLTLAALGFGLLASVTLPFASFDFDPMTLRDPDAESVSTMYELMRDGTASPYLIQVLAEDSEEAAATRERLESLETVEKTVSLAAFVPARQDEKLGIIDITALFLMPSLAPEPVEPPPAPAARLAAIRDFRDRLAALSGFENDPALSAAAGRLNEALGRIVARTAAENLASRFEQAVFRYFPEQIRRLRTSMQADTIEKADIPEPIRARFVAPDGSHRIEVYPAGNMRDRDELITFSQQVAGAAPTATGGPFQITGAGKAVRGAMLEALLYAALGIFLLLLAVFRRVRSVLLILVPITLTGIFTVAATVLFGISFNFANVIVLPLIIGLGVDAGIHFVTREHEEGSEAQVLASSTPRAVLLSALTTIGSFGSLAISAHRGMASMGILLTVALVLLLMNTLITLPAMMAWINGRLPRDA